MIAGSTFAVGSALGGACGYSLGASTAATPADDAQPSSGNVELDELRRLAVKAPIAELVEQRLFFTNTLTDRYREDEVLWRGVRRLGEEILNNSDFPDRRLYARYVAQLVDRGPKSMTRDLGSLREKLQAIR